MNTEFADFFLRQLQTSRPEYKRPMIREAYLPGAPNQFIHSANIFLLPNVSQALIYEPEEQQQQHTSNSCPEQDYIPDKETESENQKAGIKQEAEI